MRYLGLIFSIIAVLFTSHSCLAQKGEITGRVINEITQQPISDVNVYIAGMEKGAATNDSGYFYLSGLDAGNYTLIFSSVQFHNVTITDLEVIADRTIPVDITMLPASFLIGGDTGIIIPGNKYEYIIDPFTPPTLDVLTTQELQTLPTNEVSEAIPLTAGVTPLEGGGFSFRGARPGGNAYFIDGIRITGEPDLPSRAVYSMEVIPSGIPAKYGDVTGGVVVIETGSFSHR
jgi:hypothetical protein